ncbi:helix-turn-helix domain-containing protein [Actinocorallia sp. API 0066]|uniref:PucR family transcriptional regulator n=1 Tax=Actinocorallia sp. API 0066 TaxID=2896846 RepID=UPI001E49EDFA|nr:helix-turn-helix domain-containing protein [Actinocorallia sp. API 0066]MCD0448524.1 helix-turn-helix domain-containing protein [Actinocorallia sp. API 0066]
MSAPPRAVAARLRPHAGAAVAEIEREIRAHVPEYVEDDGEDTLHRAVSATTACFLDALDGGGAGTALTDLYAALGAEAAARGHGLEPLREALRVGGRVACRRLIADSYRLGWPRDTLTGLTDALFRLESEAADAAARGHARQRASQGADLGGHRARLRDALVTTPRPDLVTRYAAAAGWTVPRALAVVALFPDARIRPRIIPPDVLADWDAPVPYLVLPDPDSPGADLRLAQLTGRRIAVLGPTVPVTGGPVSFRWARQAVTLVERGVLPARPLTRCTDHLATLAASAADDLVALTGARLLGPLLDLPPDRALPLLDTLAAYLACGNNATATAQRLSLHSQTVRYRLRRITDLTGRDLDDPDARPDMMILTHWARLLLRAGEPPVFSATGP